jgi:hypothetical protein
VGRSGPDLEGTVTISERIVGLCVVLVVAGVLAVVVSLGHRVEKLEGQLLKYNDRIVSLETRAKAQDEIISRAIDVAAVTRAILDERPTLILTPTPKK